MRHFTLLGLGILLCLEPGCKKDPPPGGHSSGAAKPTPPEKKPAAADERFVEPAVSHLLLASHDSSAAEARFVGVRLGDAPSMGAPYSMPGLRMRHWSGHFRFTASVSGDVAVHATHRDSVWKLERRSLNDGKALPPIALALEDISSLMAVGDVILVGAGEQVGIVQTNAKEPAFRKLAERKGMQGKTYDLFARDGALVVAIDDVVTPIWAELLSLEEGGKHLEPYTLPSFINGTYAQALLRVSDESKRDAILFAYGNYGIMDGNGHDLTRLEIKGGKLQSGADVILNSSRLAEPPVLEEHVSRQTGKPVKLMAGVEMTPWTGMALWPSRGAPEHILLAAGARGLLKVPANFDPDTKGSRVSSVGGVVLDVMSVGNIVYVLTEHPKGTGNLVVLGHKGGLEFRARTVALPEVFGRFVR